MIQIQQTIQTKVSNYLKKNLKTSDSLSISNKMKSKPSQLFSSKFQQCLAKLRDPSTIQIGHQQFKQLLVNTQLKDVLGVFISKMDNVDRPSQRQKRQHAKLYMELIDHFGEELLLQNFYEKLMESLSKKIVCVADVIGYLCKGFLSRIHPLENTKNYIIYILTVFKSHSQIHKIIKQIVQTISPLVTSNLQNDMITLIIQKMNLSRQKAEYIESMMAIVLALEDKFVGQNLVQPLLAKNLKSQDWNVRKACVDICYTFIVVKEQINSLLHQLIKELKYDKIKNVRDSVQNYEALYKQVYGQQQSFKPQIYSQKTVRSNKRQTKSPVTKNIETLKTQEIDQSVYSKVSGKIRNETFFKNAKDSNVIRVSEDLSGNLSSFNLGNNRSHIFKKGEEDDYYQGEKLKQNRSLHLSPSPSLKSGVKRGSKQNLLSQHIKSEKGSNPISPKFNLEGISPQNEKQSKHFEDKNDRFLEDLNINSKWARKQPKILPYEADDELRKLNLSLESQQNERRQYMPIKKSQLKYYGESSDLLNKSEQKNLKLPASQFSLKPSTSDQLATPSLSLKSNIEPHKSSLKQENISTEKPSTSKSEDEIINSSRYKIQLQQMMRSMFQKFEQKIISRIDKIDARVQALQSMPMKYSFGKETKNDEMKKNILENLQDSAISLKNDNFFPFQQTNQFRKPNNKAFQSIEQQQWLISPDYESQVVQSNLVQKVNSALKTHNIDEAYSLVLANNKLQLLLKLLQGLHIPVDKTVEECLLLEVKKQINRKQVLKWLKNYLIERMNVIKSSTQGSVYRMLLKIKTQLEKQSRTKDKDFQLLKNIVINEMDEIFSSKSN